MSYVDFYLKAPDEATAMLAAKHAALPEGFALVGPDEEGNDVWVMGGPRHAFDRVGVRYEDDAVYGEDGELSTPPTPMDGWWANLRVSSDIADIVEAALDEAAPLGVERVEATGRVFL